MRTLLRSTWLMVGTVAIARACSCLPTTDPLTSSYQDTHAAVRVSVGRQVPADKHDIFADRVYTGTILESFKSCETSIRSPLRGRREKSNRRSSSLDEIMIATGGDPSVCGVDLQHDTEYILFGFYVSAENDDEPVLSVDSCEYQRPWIDLTESEVAYLRGKQRLPPPC